MGPTVTVLLWIVLPYCAFLSLVLGSLWRYRHDRFRPAGPGPDADRIEGYGATAFRFGVGLVLLARIVDVLAAGPHEHPDGIFYAAVIAAETIALPIAAAGAVMLFLPPTIAGTHPPAVTPLDRVTLPVLTAVVLSGVLVRFDPYSTADNYRAAETLFTWSRSLFTPHPNPDAIAHAPALYQFRALILLLLAAIWPYTRLAGIFAGPTVAWLARRRPQLTHLTVCPAERIRM